MVMLIPQRSMGSMGGHARNVLPHRQVPLRLKAFQQSQFHPHAEISTERQQNVVLSSGDTADTLNLSKFAIAVRK